MCGVLQEPVDVSLLVVKKTKYPALIKTAEQVAKYYQVYGQQRKRRQSEALQCHSLHKDTTPPQPNHTVTPKYIEPEQYNT
jgi:hypothetical protein